MKRDYDGELTSAAFTCAIRGKPGYVVLQRPGHWASLRSEDLAHVRPDAIFGLGLSRPRRKGRWA